MPRPPKITNERILEAARQVFLEQGFGASTLVIAERAGISEASIFKRFATKQALFLAAMGVSEQPEWMKAIAKATPSEDIKSELTDLGMQMMTFYQEVLPRVMMLMAQGNEPPHPPVPPPLRDSQALSQYLERAIAQGHLRSANAAILGHLIVGAIMNYVIATNAVEKLPFPPPFSHLSQITPAEFVHALIETLWEGIAPDP